MDHDIEQVTLPTDLSLLRGGSPATARPPCHDLRARSDDLRRRIADAQAGRWPEAPKEPPLHRPLGFLERQLILASMGEDGEGDSFLDC